MLMPVSGVSASGRAAYHRRRRATKRSEVCQREIKQLLLSGGGIGGGSGGCWLPPILDVTALLSKTRMFGSVQLNLSRYIGLTGSVGLIPSSAVINFNRFHTGGRVSANLHSLVQASGFAARLRCLAASSPPRPSAWYLYSRCLARAQVGSDLSRRDCGMQPHSSRRR